MYLSIMGVIQNIIVITNNIYYNQKSNIITFINSDITVITINLMCESKI